MATTEIYVDPSIAADSGTGTIGDPYGDLEYAIEQEDYDAVNGVRVNIKAGTDEVLAAELSVAMADTSAAGKSVAWVPDRDAPLVFQGYTAAAGDGGIGGISGGGSVAVFNDNAINHVSFIDLHLHNVGANYILEMNDFCNVINCEVNNGTGAAAISGDTSMTVMGCYVHDFAGAGIIGTIGVCTNNFFQNGATNKFTNVILFSGIALIERNIISVDSTSNGIASSGNGCFIENNSIYSNAGSGSGITTSSSRYYSSVSNNVIEGFSGSGGYGIEHGGTSQVVAKYEGNSVYNCETDLDTAPNVVVTTGGNESLSASPFTDPANDDFSPVDTGNVKEGSLPAVIGGGFV